MARVRWQPIALLLVLAWATYWWTSRATHVASYSPHVPVIDYERTATFAPITAPPTAQPTVLVTPAPATAPPTVLTGTASWYASWCNCTAMRGYRGQTVTVTGPLGTARVKINDFGPEAWLHRLIDLNRTTFQAVCGSLKLGLCTVTVTVLQ